jgi:hypothetical protein
MKISMPPGTVASPDGTVRTTGMHGSSSFPVTEYVFNGDRSDPRTPHLVSVELTPNVDDYRWYSITARDFNDNTVNETYLIGTAADLCG